MANRWPGPKYELRVEFNAPLDFVYRWCTDYTPDDAKAEGEDFERRILHRAPSQVTYEDLSDLKEGWAWSRHVVRLTPPDHWHSESVGSHRSYSLDYRLTSLPGNRTQLTMRARRRPTGIGMKNPSKSTWERDVKGSWKHFAVALERDYKKVRSKRSRS